MLALNAFLLTSLNTCFLLLNHCCDFNINFHIISFYEFFMIFSKTIHIKFLINSYMLLVSRQQTLPLFPCQIHLSLTQLPILLKTYKLQVTLDSKNCYQVSHIQIITTILKNVTNIVEPAVKVEKNNSKSKS